MSSVTLFRNTSGGWVEVKTTDHEWLDESEIKTIFDCIASILADFSVKWHGGAENLAELPYRAQRSSYSSLRDGGEHKYDAAIVYLRGVIAQMQKRLPQFRIIVAPLLMTCDTALRWRLDYQARIFADSSEVCYVLFQRLEPMVT